MSSRISSSVIAFGVDPPGNSPSGTWLGESVYQLASSGAPGSCLGNGSPRTPECQSWMASFVPSAWTASAMRASGSMLSSV